MTLKFTQKITDSKITMHDLPRLQKELNLCLLKLQVHIRLIKEDVEQFKVQADNLVKDLGERNDSSN